MMTIGESTRTQRLKWRNFVFKIGLEFKKLEVIPMEKNTFRAPAVPLATVDPFFSIWSNSDCLYDDVTHHWTDQRHQLCGLIMVDGVFFRFLGKLEPDSTRYLAEFPVLPQKSVEVLPLTTNYVFENETVRLKLSFMTPLLPDDLKLLSRPISYISYELESVDGKEHGIRLFFNVGAELAVDTTDQAVTIDKTDYSITASMGNDLMLTSSGDDQRISWGTLHLIAPGFETSAYRNCCRDYTLHQLGGGDRKAVPANSIHYYRPHPPYENETTIAFGTKLVIRDDMPVLCADKEIKLNGQANGFFCIGYDDVKSIQYFGENIEAYWKKDGETFADVAKKAVSEYDSIVARVNAFDKDLCDRASALSKTYKDIVCIAYRQTVAGHKLTWHDGELQFLSKENYSNGCIGTVDVTYPSIPLFLVYNPDLVEGMLNPIFKMIDIGLWHHDFAPHDVGQYPLANGQVYGKRHSNPEDYQMPVEECGNMLICVGALCKARGNTEYFEKHYDVLKQWADYLVSCGFDPAHQLCTDDFAGHLAHNCNLSAKGIMGLACFDMLCTMSGKDGSAYLAKAKQFANEWVNAATDGDHYRLAFDQPDTWSVKYNLVWDKLFDFNIIPKEVFETEIAYYKTKMNPYGLPLDNRADYTKSDWQMWSTMLTEDKEYFDAICERMWRFLTETPDRVPFTDWYFTSECYHRGFQARTVQGGLFINLLKF